MSNFVGSPHRELPFYLPKLRLSTPILYGINKIKLTLKDINIVINQ